MSHRTMVGLLFLVCMWFVAEGALPLPSTTIPYPFGTNIHFTEPRAGEFEMLTAAGFKYIRMDFAWASIEKEAGVYNFSNYDVLASYLTKFGLKAILILDYNNPLYDGGLSPHTDAGRAAFAKWAAASVQHFQGRGYLWEMYNEPNGGFWKPVQNVTQYAELAIAVGKVLKPAFPDEIYMGPAISWFDFNWLTTVFKLGVLEYFDLVSLHPYRQGENPETATADFAKLRQLIAQYGPQGKTFPIVSSEWGYSVNYPGKFLPRMFLTTIASHVSLSIWYDWHDDGTNSSYSEDNFGTVYYTYYANRNPCYDPKPNYNSAKTFMTVLSGYTFDEVLQTPSGDYAYSFVASSRHAYTVWTTSATNHSIGFTAVAGNYQSWDYLGGNRGTITVPSSGQASVAASDGPLYLVPQ